MYGSVQSRNLVFLCAEGGINTKVSVVGADPATVLSGNSRALTNVIKTKASAGDSSARAGESIELASVDASIVAVADTGTRMRTRGKKLSFARFGVADLEDEAAVDDVSEAYDKEEEMGVHGSFSKFRKLGRPKANTYKLIDPKRKSECISISVDGSENSSKKLKAKHSQIAASATGSFTYITSSYSYILITVFRLAFYFDNVLLILNFLTQQLRMKSRAMRTLLNLQVSNK